MLCDQSLFSCYMPLGRAQMKGNMFFIIQHQHAISSLHLNGLATHLTYSDGIMMLVCVCVHILKDLHPTTTSQSTRLGSFKTTGGLLLMLH